MKVNPVLYLKAAKRLSSNFVRGNQLGLIPEEEIKEISTKIAYYLLKYVITKPEPEFTTKGEVDAELSLHWTVLQFFSQMTPEQFMNIFPIKKFYKGHKYGIKDYYTTKAMLSKIDINQPIGDNVIDFLWDYANDDIEEFLVRHMVTISKLRRFEGKPSLAEEMAKELGLKTYRLYQDSQGQKFLLDEETGRTIRVKERPKHLKLIKGRGRGKSKIL